MQFPDYQPNFNQPIKPSLKRRTALWAFAVVAALVVSYGAVYWVNSLSDIEVHNDSLWKRAASVFPFGQDKPSWPEPDYAMPAPEKNRQDILVMGIRGEDDLADGGLLTDTMMLFSFDKTTGKSALVSIPRDLSVYVVPGRKDKINAAYENLGLGGTKKLLSRITGVYIDNAVVFNFSSFKKIVDELGGIDVKLDAPFKESSQWGYEFSLPAGVNHLDGQTALYYVRSRYSTNDFDRARRQQQVIFAIKDKALALNLASDPGKALSLLTTLKKNITTDINLFDIKNVIDLAHAVDPKAIKRSVISTDNLLVDANENGAYILLPKEGTLDGLKLFFKNVFL